MFARAHALTGLLTSQGMTSKSLWVKAARTATGGQDWSHRWQEGDAFPLHSFCVPHRDPARMWSFLLDCATCETDLQQHSPCWFRCYFLTFRMNKRQAIQQLFCDQKQPEPKLYVNRDPVTVPSTFLKPPLRLRPQANAEEAFGAANLY